MTEAEKLRYIDYLSLVEKLGEMRDEGLGLFLEGQDSTPYDIAREVVFREPDSYMRGFYVKKEKENQQES